MNQDSFFAIGRTHRICQDYAMTGARNGLPFAVISDGCSSSEYTDFGSRFLCKSIEEMIYGECDLETPVGFIQHGALIRSMSYLRGFPEECVDATLLIARIHEGKSIRVFATGDGVVAAKRRDGVIVAKVIDFKDNAPVYLSYRYNPDRKKLLLDTYDCTKTITTHFIGVGFTKTTEVHADDLSVFDFPISEYSHVSIMTDGIMSFQRLIEDNTTKTSEHVELEELLPDLMAYKGDAGAFVQRRTQKFMKQCGENGVYHDDDFTIATISI